ncbi:hypothetical protein ACWFR5_19405 [Streptomyces sp. NPDC055092]
MSEYVAELLKRVRQARLDLALALEAKDADAVSVAHDDLDDALRLARNAGVDVGGDSDAEGGRW